MDSKPIEMTRTDQATNSQLSTTGTKRGRPKQSSSGQLLRAKRMLDDVLPHLSGFADLQRDAAALRDKVLSAFVEQERKALNIGE